MTDSKIALITGITGMDGSHLAELLLDKEYSVYGLIRRLSTPNIENIRHILDQIHLIDGDLSDYASIANAINVSKPNEIFQLGAQSFVATSWQQAELTANITGLGALRVFQAARQHEEQTGRHIRIYQASSSEQFGESPPPQNEDTSMRPRSPYAASKIFAHNMARIYRESYKMFVSCGICFNHSGSRRGIEFVSRKISDGVAKIKLGLSKELKLGNLDTRRDWSYASDMVEAMYQILQQDKPDDFVLGSGESHSVREFAQLAFWYVGLNYEDYVKIDKSLYRPAEVNYLQADCTKARNVLGWSPKVSFEDLVKIMVDADLKILKKELS